MTSNQIDPARDVEARLAHWQQMRKDGKADAASAELRLCDAARIFSSAYELRTSTPALLEQALDALKLAARDQVRAESVKADAAFRRS